MENESNKRIMEWSPAIATPVIGNKMINSNDKIK